MRGALSLAFPKFKAHLPPCDCMSPWKPPAPHPFPTVTLQSLPLEPVMGRLSSPWALLLVLGVPGAGADL